MFAKAFSSNKSNPAQVVTPIEPLSRQFFSHLVKLETLFHNKQYTISTLDELIQNYAKAVEYYDTVKDEIATYFIFKIQDCLATQKSLKLLFDQKHKEDQMKTGLASPLGSMTPHSTQNKGGKRITFPSLPDTGEEKSHTIEEVDAGEQSDENEEEHDVVNDAVDSDFIKRKKAYANKRITKAQASFSVMKREQQKFVTFFHKLETEKTHHTQDVHSIMGEYGDSTEVNDRTIQSDVSKQKDRIRERLEQRKHQTFLNHSLNTSGHYGGGSNGASRNDVSPKKENVTIQTANILRDINLSLHDNMEMVGLSNEQETGSMVDLGSSEKGPSKPDINLQFYEDETPQAGVDSLNEKKGLTDFSNNNNVLDLSPIANSGHKPHHRRFKNDVISLTHTKDESDE